MNESKVNMLKSKLATAVTIYNSDVDLFSRSHPVDDSTKEKMERHLVDLEYEIKIIEKAIELELEA